MAFEIVKGTSNTYINFLFVFKMLALYNGVDRTGVWAAGVASKFFPGAGSRSRTNMMRLRNTAANYAIVSVLYRCDYATFN
jgi:hypothetical protein